MTKRKSFSHEQVLAIMHYYLSQHIVGDVKRGKDSIRFVNDHETQVVSPVNKKTQPGLEKTVTQNTSDGIATVVVLPKSSKEYQGNYLQPVGRVNFSEGGNKRWHHAYKLASIERYLIDELGNPTYYFDPRDLSITSVQFRRFPKWFVASQIGLRPPTEEDQELLQYGEELKERIGRGYTNSLLPEDRNRYIELKTMQNTRDTIREVLNPEKLSKGILDIQLEQGLHGLLLGKLVLYDKQKSQPILL